MKRIKLLFIMSVMSAGAALTAADNGQKSQVDWLVGINPDLTGNVALDTALSLNYLDALNAGISYGSTRRGEAKTPTDSKVDLEVVSTKVWKLRALGYRLDLSDQIYILPALNGQYVSQTKTGNVTDRATEEFVQTNSRLASTQGNVDLTSGMKFGGVEIMLNFGISPLNVSEEATKFFDSASVKTKTDSLGNITYSGLTGDFTMFTETSTSYMSGGLDIIINDLIGSSDLLIGFKFQQISYESNFTGNAVYNGQQVEQSKTTSFEQTDITINMGAELTFLGLGDMARPFGSLTYTLTKYGNQDDSFFGAAISFRK